MALLQSSGIGLSRAVLAFEVSPQLDPTFVAWETYWRRVAETFPLDIINVDQARQYEGLVLNSMRSDILMQGDALLIDADQLAQWVTLGRGASLTNVALAQWIAANTDVGSAALSQPIGASLAAAGAKNVGTIIITEPTESTGGPNPVLLASTRPTVSKGALIKPAAADPTDVAVNAGTAVALVTPGAADLLAGTFDVAGIQVSKRAAAIVGAFLLVLLLWGLSQ